MGGVLLKTQRRELDAMLEHLEEELGESFKEVSHGLVWGGSGSLLFLKSKLIQHTASNEIH